MAKHLGERARPPRPTLPRGLGWALGAVLLVAVLTTVAVVRGLSSDAPADLTAATSGTATPQPGASTHDKLTRLEAVREAEREAAASATRSPKLSRQAVRPSKAPYHVKSGPTLALRRNHLVEELLDSPVLGNHRTCSGCPPKEKAP